MGLSFQCNIKNLGNIDNANITIKPLTIIAGENSRGKTFVTKSLYTILNSIYQDHFSTNLIKEYQLLDNLCIDFIEGLNNTTP
jgi:predicted ATPase